MKLFFIQNINNRNLQENKTWVFSNKLKVIRLYTVVKWVIMISCFNNGDNLLKNLKTNKNRKTIKDFDYVKYVPFYLFIPDIITQMKGWTRENFTFLIITFLSNNQKWNFLSRPQLIIHIIPTKIFTKLSHQILLLILYQYINVSFHREIIVLISNHTMFSILDVFFDHP